MTHVSFAFEFNFFRERNFSVLQSVRIFVRREDFPGARTALSALPAPFRADLADRVLFLRFSQRGAASDDHPGHKWSRIESSECRFVF